MHATKGSTGHRGGSVALRGRLFPPERVPATTCRAAAVRSPSIARAREPRPGKGPAGATIEAVPPESQFQRRFSFASMKARRGVEVPRVHHAEACQPTNDTTQFSAHQGALSHPDRWDGAHSHVWRKRNGRCVGNQFLEHLASNPISLLDVGRDRTLHHTHERHRQVGSRVRQQQSTTRALCRVAASSAELPYTGYLPVTRLNNSTPRL